VPLPLLRPPRLAPGQTIALISPSGPLPRTEGPAPETLAAARARLEEAGFRTVLAPHALGARGYLAGRDEDRLSDLHAAFADSDIHGVLCLRGGYGALRLLDRVDYALVRRHPKVFIGYSDVTALHAAFYTCARLVTFHGPMAARLCAADGDARDALIAAVSRPAPLGALANPPGAPPVETLVPGTAEGPLLGGNAALLTAVLGTRYAPPFAGAILFLEDIVDHAYRLDRKLVQLRLAGALDAAAGIVVGETLLRPGSEGPALTIREILDDIVVPLGKPAIYGLAFGHGAHQLTLPVGVRARLDASRQTLSILEPAVM
jgi:muramoyltetrapeptide carboxypeptidase